MDKDSVRYFMTEMSQKEFEERNKDKIKCTDFKFNRIQPERSKREDFDKCPWVHLDHAHKDGCTNPETEGECLFKDAVL